jgi:hypothetical protein
VLMVVVIDGKFADNEWLLSLMECVLMVVVIDGKFADSEWLLSLMGLYQIDCNKITVQS